MNKIKSIFFSAIAIIFFCTVYFLIYNIAEHKAYDFMTKHVLIQKLPFDKFKKNYGSDDIVLVVIDAKTVEKYRWPWKRETNCKIFEYFYKYTQPKVVVHDSILVTLDNDNPNSDRKYFKTLNKFNNLIVGFMPNFYPWKDKKVGEQYDKAFSKYSITVENKTSKSPLLYESMMSFPKPYLDIIKHAGSVSMLPGSISGNINKYFMDEIYRNHEYFLKYNNGIYPSLALKTFLIANNYPKTIITDKSIEFPELNYKIKLNKNHYQSTSPIKFYKNKNGVYTHTYYSAVDIMDSYDSLIKAQKPLINPNLFKDKIIVIGANVPAGTGLNDNKNSPIMINHPGVDIQATAIDNIMHNDFLKIIPNWLNILITLIGMIFVYGFIRVNTLSKSIYSIIFVIGTYLILSIILFYFNIIINVLTPIVMFILTTILGYTHKFVLENKSKEKVKSAMGKYISEDIMKRVMQDIDNLGLGGKRANVTVLFSDIRGFTSMSEQMSPAEVSEILNEYFTEMEPIITQYNGVINKFIGDAVMAIFGEPIQDKKHAENAVKCAYAMLEKVKELQKKWANEGKPKIEIGVGINTGEVFVGNIGSINRMEYTVIGDTVNLASRLESYNKTYKTKLLISTTTYEEVKGIVDVIKISDVQIRGKAHKMDIYEVLKVEID
ncbi:adenylate/guanylate cyclase domain-containing protein [bacterium]|nr:adenylate/guanylate cyclase domain-containing protein [bacterium]